MAQVEAKKKQLLAANKAAARILLLGVFSESKEPAQRIGHNYNGIDKDI